jgi:hypothetical protein
LIEYGDMEDIEWKWESVDGTMIKAPLAHDAAGPNPSDRGEERKQAPSAGGQAWRPAGADRYQANRHNVSQLAAILDTIVIPLPKEKRFLYADQAIAEHLLKNRSGREGLHSSSYTKEVGTNPPSQEQTLGHRGDTLLVQPISEIARQIRKVDREVRSYCLSCCSNYLLEEGSCFLRISP